LTEDAVGVAVIPRGKRWTRGKVKAEVRGVSEYGGGEAPKSALTDVYLYGIDG